LIQHSPDDAPPAAPRLIVPAYFHPATHPREWEWLARHPARIRLIILNLANGPGVQPDGACLPALDRVRATGIAVCGYVDTDYGRRPADEALDDLRRHLDWYQVDGVFFDRAATGAGQLSHYAGLAGRARDAGARLVAFNHGAHPVEAYADHADLLGTFEGSWSAYIELGVPRWVRSRPAGQFFHLLHTVPAASMPDAWWLAGRRHAGCSYVTDRAGDNPWDGLPAGENAATTTPLALGSCGAARPPGRSWRPGGGRCGDACCWPWWCCCSRPAASSRASSPSPGPPASRRSSRLTFTPAPAGPRPSPASRPPGS
jgi:hypothetical protein